MSRFPESPFFDGHVDAFSYIHFIHERILFITKISFNRKILENDLQIKLTQNFLVPIPFDGFSFSAACLPPCHSARVRRRSRRICPSNFSAENFQRRCCLIRLMTACSRKLILRFTPSNGSREKKSAANQPQRRININQLRSVFCFLTLPSFGVALYMFLTYP